MKEKISLYKKRSFEIISRLTKNQKIYIVAGILLVTGTIGTLVYANGNHDEAAPVEVKQSEQVVVRKVGDVDADAISQEGLSSFYGEITSKDIASINPSREGVISSWNVSVGDAVSAGEVLGYITVTGVSADQQQQLAQQQANALKAQLDLETANKIAEQTDTVFGKIGESLKSIADKQRQQYTDPTGVVNGSYKTELSVLKEKKALYDKKIQDFSKTSLTEIYQMIGANNLSPLNNYDGSWNYISLAWGYGQRNDALVRDYTQYVSDVYAKKARNNTATLSDIQSFLSQTIWILSSSIPNDTLTQARIEEVTQRVTAIQTDFRELSNQALETSSALAGKEREQAQIDIELAKSLNTFDNDLSLKKLDQLSANERAKNEAKGAELLAQKLATNAGGIIPVIASRSGVIATIEKNVSDYVTISQRIGFISSRNPQKMVRFTIPPSWKDINKGDTLAISWRPEFAVSSGIISGISPTVDEKGGYQAEAQLSKETPFPVGASVRIIPESSKKGVFVQHKAVVFEGIKPYVWIVTENNTIRKQEIKPGRGLGEYVEVLSGLERGFSYLVILDPQIILENGKPLSEIIKTKVDTNTPKKIQNESVPHSHDE